MNWIKQYFIRSYALEYLKKLLDYLPLNGSKRLIGVLIVIVTELAKMFPNTDYNFLLQAILETLQGYDYVTLPIGMTTLVIGLVHWILKLAYGKESTRTVKN